MLLDEGLFEFEWDAGNVGKNGKHGVSDSESEEVFFDSDKMILKDILHSHAEERLILLGNTKKKRLLFVAFTRRKNRVRIISARDVNKKERGLYEKKS